MVIQTETYRSLLFSAFGKAKRRRYQPVRLSWTVLLIYIFAYPSELVASEMPIIAIFDIEDQGSGLSEESLSRLTNYLSVLLAEGGFQVVPRDQIRQRLLEVKKESHQSCYDQACQVELGRELAAQFSVSTQIIRIGDQCRLTASFYNLRKATTSKAASARAECTEKSLGNAAEKLAKQLTQSVGKQNLEIGTQEKNGAEKESVARLAQKEPQPFLPDRNEPVETEDRDKGSSVLSSWWFWTLIAVGVAGAGGGLAYMLTAGKGESADLGNIEVGWQ